MGLGHRGNPQREYTNNDVCSAGWPSQTCDLSMRNLHLKNDRGKGSFNTFNHKSDSEAFEIW